jgi:hypothetical protein
MCPREATSREHVPPAAFFPEPKDSPNGKDYRRNLLTVPSCRVHNTARSGDDQYIAVVIASTIQSNEVAHRLMTPKTIRALHQRPGLVGFFHGLTAIHVGAFETGAFLVDRARFDRAADHYARGLYYNNFTDKLTGTLKIHTSSLFLASGADSPVFNAQLQELTDVISRGVQTAPHEGQNPDIFYYQVIRDSTNRAIIRMVFYGGFVIDAFAPNIAGHDMGDA